MVTTPYEGDLFRIFGSNCYCYRTMPNAYPDLKAIARQVMLHNGFQPDFGAAVRAEVASLPNSVNGAGVRDLRALPWSSIDNDDSRDLDQIEYAEALSDGAVRVLVGIADVDAFAPKSSPIDQHAAAETTTVYAGVVNFPMLPNELSTGITSLLENEERLAVVTEFVVSAEGEISEHKVYRALVRNRAQLHYSDIGNWLDNAAPPPQNVAGNEAIQQQLRLQDGVASALSKNRFAHGALNIDNPETRPVLVRGEITDIQTEAKNRASSLIEELMIAANECVARTFSEKGIASIRRVVKTPERWPRIVELAAKLNEHLPQEPDSKALNDFLTRRKAADPDHFPDLSLAVIKLMGPGEYVLQKPGDTEQGHFGLAVQDYTHSTAPNRRFADVVTQRLLKAELADAANPYSDDELSGIAKNCTDKASAARKVERQMQKSIAAVAMQRHIGQAYDAIVTGKSDKGTFVRVLNPAVEGMLLHPPASADVGERLRVKLVEANPERGFIDFVAL
jgi:VacB/RNase II family 3'-5' exoribonuclease